MQKGKKKIWLLLLLCFLMLAGTACKEDESEKTEATETVKDGLVESPDDFISLGLLIDVNSSELISDVSYEIVNQEIASVSFVYNGIQCQFRGSAVYSDFELAGVENNGMGDMLITTVGGYNATYYKLNPGRVVFWSDENIHYSLYVYVTAEDSVLDGIVSYLKFENHYDERADVIENVEEESRVFAEKIVTIIQNKDIHALAENMNYPQELGNGMSVGNVDELMAISADDIFTDKLLEAVNEESLDNLRAGRDGDSFLIGSNYKNIYFRKTEDGTFKIIKINN